MKTREKTVKLFSREKIAAAMGLDPCLIGPVNPLANPLALSADRSDIVDSQATRHRELASQGAGALPGTTDHPEDGQAVARVKRFRRYRNAALGAPRTVSIGSLAPVKLHVVDGVELGAWIGSDVTVYVAAAEVDREEVAAPGRRRYLGEATENIFNLDGFSPGDSFLGCMECGWKLEPGSACKPICPDCRSRLSVFTVTKEDCCANGVADICDECDQRHGPGDEECEGQDAEETSP